MTDILYKYRSLDNFKNFVDIILKNRLYAAEYKNLNDPMEGQYYYGSNGLDRQIQEKLMNEKDNLRVCSLSRTKSNELMWSHYADGHRGVAIGLRIIHDEVRPIQYNGLAFIQNQDYNYQTAIEILSHKLEIWSYEEEERAFIRGSNFIDIQIEEIIIGRVMSNPNYSFVKELIEKINPRITILKAKEYNEFDM